MSMEKRYFGRHLFQRRELVDAGVVDQDVEPLVAPLCGLQATYSQFVSEVPAPQLTPLEL
jgi:hypothetical protein